MSDRLQIVLEVEYDMEYITLAHAAKLIDKAQEVLTTDGASIEVKRFLLRKDS